MIVKYYHIFSHDYFFILVIYFYSDIMAKKTFFANKENQDIIDKYILEYKAKKSNNGNISHAVRSKDNLLRKLSDYLEKNTKHKSLLKATKEELLDFFNNNIYVTEGSHNITGTTLISFYKWVYDLDKHERPPNLKWFEQTNKRTKKRLSRPERKTELLITPEEYKIILEYSNDSLNQNKAIWETYYLSGFRPDELPSMTISDVHEDKDTGIVSISCPRSKTRPRTIDLTEYPENLIRYIGNHPLKNNKNAPLFFPLKGSHKIKPSTMNMMEQRWRSIRKKTSIKPTLNIKSFRKTRFTIMANARSKDGGLIYKDEQLADHFGWEINTVAQRRRDYDLTKNEEMRKIILSKPIISKSYDTILKEKEKIEDKYLPKIEKLEKEIKERNDLIKDLNKRVNESREDFKNLKNDLPEIFNYITGVINKQQFTAHFMYTHKDEYDEITKKQQEKTLTKKEWNDFDIRLENEYKEWVSKGNNIPELTSLDDIKNYRINKRKSIIESLK